LWTSSCAKPPFFLSPRARVLGDGLDGHIDIGGNIVVEFLVLSGETPRLPDIVTHAGWLRGKNGVASSRGSDIEINASAFINP
jgi:hypothetical protein